MNKPKIKVGDSWEVCFRSKLFKRSVYNSGTIEDNNGTLYAVETNGVNRWELTSFMEIHKSSFTIKPKQQTKEVTK